MSKDQHLRFLNVRKVTLNKEEELSFTEADSFMMDILNELQENIDPKFLSELTVKPSITFQGRVTRKQDHGRDEYLLMTGHIEASFYTLDSTTGNPMIDRLLFPIKACFIDKSQQKFDPDDDELEVDEGLDESIEIIKDGEMWDLYFYQNSRADLFETFREYVFLNMNYYPRSQDEE